MILSHRQHAQNVKNYSFHLAQIVMFPYIVRATIHNIDMTMARLRGKTENNQAMQFSLLSIMILKSHFEVDVDDVNL